MNLQGAYYELRFENEFLRAKADAFQTLFERLMGLAFKGDFLPCRPWGRRGDRKNDGFLKSERRLFQVYAPNEMDERKAILKIAADFEGAKVHWGDLFDKWSFVHNATGDLPPHVLRLLLEFEKNNPGISLDPWGLNELRDVFRRLSPEDLAGWFGPPITEEIRARMGFSDLQVVLAALAAHASPPGAVVTAVPPGKIEANDLSESIAVMLKCGMTKAPLVSAFLDAWHDESLGERLAVAFRGEYERLRGTMHPNRIFATLQSWAGGDGLGTPEHQMAVFAVLAYYFERCDIFEEPRGVQQ